MITQIHVLCLNPTEIGSQKVGETMRPFLTKIKSSQNAEGAKSLQGSVSHDPASANQLPLRIL